MKVGIIIYSQTGNTLEVAEQLASSLRKNQIEVQIERITVEDKTVPRKNPFKIETAPDISKYDVVIFGSLVEGFCLSPVMKKYIDELDIEGKDVYGYVTHFFPYSFLGGKSSIRQMSKHLECHGGNVVYTDVIDWKSQHRKEKIETMVENFTELIKTTNN